jgi:hypothetical protein
MFSFPLDAPRTLQGLGAGTHRREGFPTSGPNRRNTQCLQRISGILASSRAEHTQAVKDRISSVEQMKDVVDLTKGLFGISKVRRITFHHIHI